jgi:hypothetical protein
MANPILEIADPPSPSEPLPVSPVPDETPDSPPETAPEPPVVEPEPEPETDPDGPEIPDAA